MFAFLFSTSSNISFFKLICKNTVLIVGSLHEMCKVNIVIKAKNDEDVNEINTDEIQKNISQSEIICNVM